MNRTPSFTLSKVCGHGNADWVEPIDLFPRYNDLAFDNLSCLPETVSFALSPLLTDAIPYFEQIEGIAERSVVWQRRFIRSGAVAICILLH